MADHITAITAALATICEVWDGRIDSAPERAFLRVDDGGSDSLHTIGNHRGERGRFGVICVNNNPGGVRLLASRVRATLDGLNVEGRRVRISDTGPVIEDRGDPSAYRWSQTVNCRLTHD